MDSLGFPFDAEYVENQKFFMDEADPPEVIVWLESHDDSRLWLQVFDDIKGFNFTFKESSIFVAPDEKFANGCDRLLSLMVAGEISLSKYQIFCLDSDFKFISGFADSYKNDYEGLDHIYWTRVHSKENVYLNPVVIDRVISHLVGIPERQLAQPSSIVFNEFSVAIFEPFMRLLFLQAVFGFDKQELLIGYKKEFKRIIDILKEKPIEHAVKFQGCELWDRFCSELESLFKVMQHRIDTEGLESEFEGYRSKVAEAGVNAGNIYLFVRGHDLYEVFDELSCKVIESYKKLKIVEIKSACKKKASDKISEYVRSFVPFGICLKSREPVLDGVSFFSDTLSCVKSVYG
jgi:hypothetical protein